MRVLALDTTTSTASAALVDDDRLVIERVGGATGSHAARLPGDLTTLLREAGAELASIDVFAVASGPGSFTGLRIGIATMQGLAFVQGRPMVALSALEALAQCGSLDVPIGAVVGAWIDAHRGDVFSAAYRVADAAAFTPERLIEIEGAAVAAPGATTARWQDRWGAPTLLIGDGAVMYRAAAPERTRLVAAPPLAGAIGRMAVARARAGGAVNPAAVQPLYVRRPDAELARERGSLASTLLAKNGKERP